MSEISTLEIFQRAERHFNRKASIASEGVFSYRQLLDASAIIASCLLAGENDLQEKRIAFLVPPGFQYVATQWGIWRAGGIAVPLGISHPQPELEYVLADTDAKIIIAHPDFAKILPLLAAARNAKFLLTTEIMQAVAVTLPAIDVGRRAMIVYTSGTTSKPKGVVATHKNIAAQIKTLIEAWEWTAADRILHVLLGRYGMTEIGMALSNPLHGERVPGCVGAPLAGVEVRLVDDDGKEVEDGIPGEILVKSPSVFLEYWNKPAETQIAFRDGWFCTGDVAVVQKGVYRILGRRSVDIIKTGGYKVSALEIEEVLRTHPEITECAVVGVADRERGERVCAALVLTPQSALQLDSLRRWAQERLAVYKIPAEIVIVADLPRNAMGKVMKPEVKKIFAASNP